MGVSGRIETGAVSEQPGSSHQTVFTIGHRKHPDILTLHQFPHALHLQTGETFPCQIIDYDGKTISFQSPFISAQDLDSANMKALEFSDRTHAPGIDRTQPVTDFDSLTVRGKENGFKEIKMQRVGQANGGKVRFVINADDTKKIDMKKMNEGQLVLAIVGKDGVEKVKGRNPRREMDGNGRRYMDWTHCHVARPQKG